MANKTEVMQKYLELHKLYKGTSKAGIIKEAEGFILEKKYDRAEALLNTLPSKDALLNKLFEELKGKPVHKTLRKIMEGKCGNLYEGLKGLFSLGTHLCVELEKGNMEYKGLLEEVLSTINKQVQ